MVLTNKKTQQGRRKKAVIIKSETSISNGHSQKVQFSFYVIMNVVRGGMINLCSGMEKQKYASLLSFVFYYINGQMSSFEFLFLGWLFASQKSGFSGLRYRFIPSLRFGTGFASPYNPCHGL